MPTVRERKSSTALHGSHRRRHDVTPLPVASENLRNPQSRTSVRLPPVAPCLPSATRQAKAGRVPLRASSGKSTQASPAASGRPPGGREWALLADKFKNDAIATGIHPEEIQEEVGNVEAVIFQAMQCDGYKEVANKLLAVRKTMSTYVVA